MPTKLRVAVYNMEWMVRLFDAGGNPKTTGDEGARSANLAQVVQAIDPDVLGIVEGPDTTTSGSRSTAQSLVQWARLHGLDPSYEATHGFVSGGQQELAVLYKSSRVRVRHKPTKAEKKNPFDQPFLVDTTDSLIKEHYEHYRPPLEVEIQDTSGNELARAIVVHAKSKGIFERVDMARFEQLSERNRKKLYAECMSVRERCDQWLEEQPDRRVIVMGDVNDGFGMDFYERRFMRSAVDVLLGDLWKPEQILKHVLPQPKLTQYGWKPASSRFTDRVTGDSFNVLIDHLLVSTNVKVANAQVWNPYENDAAAVQAVAPVLKAPGAARPSDHYPVSAELTV